MSHLRLAVFDVDGTLVDSEHNIVTAMHDAWCRLELGELPRPEDVRRIIGLSLVEACSVLLPFAPHEMHRTLAQTYKEAFRAIRVLPDTMEPLFPGVVEALDRLEEEGWLLGLATGKSRRGVDAVLEAHGLSGRFLNIQTADDNPGKPNPAMLLRAAAETGLDPKAMIMIGDTAYDMKMAGAARTGALGVAWGYHSMAELNEAGAQKVVDSFENLHEVLRVIAEDRGCV